MKTFVSGFLVAIVLCAVLQWAFPTASVPPKLKCGVRTNDGCVLWFDPVRVERFKNGQAGKGTFGSFMTGDGAAQPEGEANG